MFRLQAKHDTEQVGDDKNRKKTKDKRKKRKEKEKRENRKKKKKKEKQFRTRLPSFNLLLTDLTYFSHSGGVGAKCQRNHSGE